MNPEQLHPDLENTVLLPEIRIKPSSSPRFAISSTSGSSTPTATPTAGANRKIAIAVDLSDESAYAVKWAVQNYLRPGDAVVLLHVRPTCVLYGADWGSVGLTIDGNVASDSSEDSQQKLEEEYDAFTSTKASILAQPLLDSHIPYKLHIVKDHDMKERLCLEVERLGLSAVIMGSRGFGASRKRNKAGLGSVSDYCVHHCVCPVVVVRYPEEKESDVGDCDTHPPPKGIVPEIDLHPVPEEQEYHDASDEQQTDMAPGIKRTTAGPKKTPYVIIDHESPKSSHLKTIDKPYLSTVVPGKARKRKLMAFPSSSYEDMGVGTLPDPSLPDPDM